MSDPIRLARSVVGDREKAAVSDVIERGYLGSAKETQRFEHELAMFIGGDREVVCTSSGTSALQLALQACGVGPGDEVIVPSFTFVSCFQAISGTGARPVACDVLLASGNIDVANARTRITDRTRAIMPVYYASETPDLEGVYALTRQHGLRVVEDAAHAFGCRSGDARVGADGDVLCFSFDGIKNITSGEGGAVVTSDSSIAATVRDARFLGVEKDTEQRYRSERSWDFDVAGQGWRAHMSDVMAAIGRVQLTRLDSEFEPRRVEFAGRYRDRLANMVGVSLFESNLGPVIPHIISVRVLDGRRDQVRSYLQDRGCQVGIHYKPNHLLGYFRQSVGELPVSERLGDDVMSIPLHPLLTDTQQERVLQLLEEALEVAHMEEQ